MAQLSLGKAKVDKIRHQSNKSRKIHKFTWRLATDLARDHAKLLSFILCPVDCSSPRCTGHNTKLQYQYNPKTKIYNPIANKNIHNPAKCSTIRTNRTLVSQRTLSQCARAVFTEEHGRKLHVGRVDRFRKFCKQSEPTRAVSSSIRRSLLGPTLLPRRSPPIPARPPSTGTLDLTGSGLFRFSSHISPPRFRLPSVCGGLLSVMPLHSAVASAHLRSAISPESESWGVVPQGDGSCRVFFSGTSLLQLPGNRNPSVVVLNF